MSLENNLFTKEDIKCPFLVKENVLPDNEHSQYKDIQARINSQIQYITNFLENPRFKDSVINNFIIKPENIPTSYFEHHWNNAVARGAVYDLSDKYKKDYIERIKKITTQNIINAQIESLGIWYDYLTSAESNDIPEYIRYWIFKRMVNLGPYNRKEKKFEKRKKATTAPFPELNQEALHNVINRIQDFDQSESPNFKDLYSEEFAKLQEYIEKNWEITSGQWFSFKGEPDAENVFKKLQGKNSGFCIANLDTAKNYLKRGILEIYFSEDKEGSTSNPRVAIHIVNGRVNEVRGVQKNQNLDEYILPVVKEKILNYPEGEKYFVKCEHMEKLGEIYNKHLNGTNLSAEEIVFIYEIEEKIQGFGYSEDARLKDMLTTRDMRYDLSIVYDCLPDEISTTPEESLEGNIKYHYSTLDLNPIKKLQPNIKLPHTILGDLDMSSYKTLPDNFFFPEVIYGDLILNNLSCFPTNFTFTKKIGNVLDLSKLECLPDNFCFQKKIDELYLNNLCSIPASTILPIEIKNYLGLGRVAYLPNNINIPQDIDNIYLQNLLALPDNFRLSNDIISRLDLDKLERLPNNFKFPKHIKGYLGLGSLTILPETTVLPEATDGTINLSSVISLSDKIVFPQKIGGDLLLSSVTTIPVDYVFPEDIVGDLDLSSLSYIPEGCVLPKNIGGGLDLSNISSLPADFVFPKHISGDLDLSSITSIPEDSVFPENIGGNLDLSSLISLPSKFSFLKTINGDIYSKIPKQVLACYNLPEGIYKKIKPTKDIY